MNRINNVGLLLILCGFGILIYAVMSGSMNFSIFLIFPVIWGTGVVAALAMVLIFIGMILLFFSYSYGKSISFYDNQYTEPVEHKVKKQTKIGGFVLIGPVPIIFGSDRKLMYISLILLVIFVILFLIYLQFW